MTLRLIEMVVPEHEGEELQKLLAEQHVLEFRQIGLCGGEAMVRRGTAFGIPANLSSESTL